MSAVQVRNLAYSYKDHVALKGISFEVGKGEIFGLVGPNGGGKSTVFKILSTLQAVQQGEASLFGISLKDPQRVRRSLGVVFQKPALDLKLTVWENLLHQGHLYGMRGPVLRESALALLRQVGLLDRKNEVVQKLSGGLQRRLDVAKALLHSPSLLILDEPTTGLDPVVRRDLWQYFRQLRLEKGMTLLLTTHLLEEADQCDRIALLHQGNLVAMGTPADLKASIGGEVISIETSDPEALRARIRERFSLEAQLLPRGLRIETHDSHRLVPALVQEISDGMDSFRLSKPTLEDLLIQKTGDRLNEVRP